MCNIECPYKCKCTSHPHKCPSCRRNTGKRDYYVPRRWHDWYTPHWTPYYPPYRHTWSTADNHTTWTNTYTATTANHHTDTTPTTWTAT